MAKNQFILYILFILSLCSLVSAQEIDSECYSTADVNEKIDCYLSLAKSINDFEDCSKLRASFSRGICYTRFIENSDDCGKIGNWDNFNRDSCYLKFAQVGVCEKIQTNALRGECYFRLAEQGHTHYCDKITYTQKIECYPSTLTGRQCINLKSKKARCYKESGSYLKYLWQSGLIWKLLTAAIISIIVWTAVLLLMVGFRKIKFLSNFICEAAGVIFGSVFFSIFTIAWTKIWSTALWFSSTFLCLALSLQSMFGLKLKYPRTGFTNPILTAFLLISFWILFIWLIKYLLKDCKTKKYKTIILILVLLAFIVLNIITAFALQLSTAV